MSFGGGFGSGGGFGFGNNNNNNNPSNTFGNNNAASSGGGGPFGSTATTGGFGSGGGFGNTATASGGGLFGGAANTAGTGGFGGFGNTNNTNTSSAFGAGNSSGGAGLFGNKTGGFGTTNTGGSSVFGGGSSTTGGFGANNISQPSGGLFGAGNAGTGGFGANNNASTGGFGGFGVSNNAAVSNDGTSGTPFQAFQEKDGSSSQTSSYQSITFQPPYQKKSFEELRTEDYLQGRRYGNSNGQAGTFGQTTGFGGSVLGNNNTSTGTGGGGLFGGANTSTANTGTTFGGGFGANNTTTNTTGGFGNNTGGGLFGIQNKPAGGLFGQGANTGTTGGFGTTAPSSGGLFGANNNQQQNTGFGASSNTNTGGGLFGNNATQNKSAFGAFGQTNTTNTGFGSTNNTGGGLFGANNNQQQTQQPASGGLFGSSTNTGGGGMFGNTQNKPAAGGLFGSTTTSTNTGGGLFGANNSQPQQNTSGGLFGANNNNNTSGGLFGNNNQQQNKPGGLFGSTTTNTNTGGGLFGATNSNNTGGGLFGNTANNNTNTGGNSVFGGGQPQIKPGGLFGSTANNNNTGSSLFGAPQNPQGGSGLFGSTQNQNNSSLFGSVNQTNNQQQPNQLHASLTMSPYGNDQLFSSLGQSAAPIGPLATPLAGARPAPSRTPSLLSSTRLNSPIYTPRTSTLGRQATYGFSHSNFGTPNSSFSSSLTPQASSLLKPTNSLGGVLTSKLARSMSMQNLRGIDTPTREGGSLLRPTPGSASSRYLETGSMRKLKIDRSLRQDLFAPPEQRQELSPPLHKKVSFDNSASGSRQTDAEPNAANALVRTETEGEDVSPAASRSHQRPNGTHVEMQQVNGASLTDIPEDAEPQRPASAPATKRPAEKTMSRSTEIGEYWSKPSLKELKAMSRSQLQHLSKFEVGRHGIGKIQFSRADLSNTDLDQLFGEIVKLEKNSATVYPTDAGTPPRGQGLNVPSKIWLENSWPRSHGGQRVVLREGTPAYEKHIRRFKRITGTQFDRYEPETGTWVFDVDHFTTYELDDDDDDDMTDMLQDTSGLSEPPATPGNQDDIYTESNKTPNGAAFDQDDVDDTFEFKHTIRSKSSLRNSHIPGGFDHTAGQNISYDYDDSSADEHGKDDYMMAGGLGDADNVFTSQGGAIHAPPSAAFERQQSSMVLDDSRPDDIAEALQDETEPDPEMPGSFIAEEPRPFRSILKPSTSAFRTSPGPEKLVADTWEDQLQRTMSPKKRDRRALKGVQQSLLDADRDDYQDSPFKRSMLGQSQLGQSYLAQKSAKVGLGASTLIDDQWQLGKSQAFNTSMDIMNSLFAEERSANRVGAVQGFENPYTKKPRLSASADLDENDAAFHNTMKPRMAENGTLVYAVPRTTPQVDHPLEQKLRPIIGPHREVRFAGLRHQDRNDAFQNGKIALVRQKDCTDNDSYALGAKLKPERIVFRLFAAHMSPEEDVWRTASQLWDPIKDAAEDLISGMSEDDIDELEPQLRRDAFALFWAERLAAEERQLSASPSPEEKALDLLTINDVVGAAELLAKARDFRLAIIVAQLPGTEDSRNVMQAQIDEWRARNDWSEMSDAIRALYSIAAGQVCVVQGKNGPKEDRCDQFNIGERFGLTWKQSFGLRLFFGGHANMALAVQSYVEDLASGREQVQPVPSWAGEKDPANGSEHIVLGLLRIASADREHPADLPAIFDSKAVSGSALHSRLAWQLMTLLYAKGLMADLSLDKLDQLTYAFAAELEMTGELVSAIWVLAHLKDRESRDIAIRQTLFRNGDKISEWTEPPAEEEYRGNRLMASFRQLAEDLQINRHLLWEAKAQYAHAVNNPLSETRYLINANLISQADQIIATSIGPKAIIEEDYGDLSTGLEALAQTRDSSRLIEVYRSFVKLVGMNSSRRQSPEGLSLVQDLAQELSVLKDNGSRVGGPALANRLALEEKVAFIEMERVVRETLRNHGYNAVEHVSSHPRSDAGLWLKYQRAMGSVA